MLAVRWVRMVWAAPLVCLLMTAVGCDVGHQVAVETHASEIGLPVIAGDRLPEYLRSSESPVLVEFGVDFNCPRCIQTQPGVVKLRETLEGEVDVIRVDFNRNVRAVAALGGTVCPTYVLFDREKHLLTRSYPVSIDFLEGEILRQLGK